MDYKYIEQLLERYWRCDTTTDEEAILRMFFAQREVPAHLQQYKSLFAAENMLQKASLGDDFEARMLRMVEEKTTVARPVTLTRRLMPLYKAAACVAILLTLGRAAQQSFRTEEPDGDYNYAGYAESYSDPEAAYDRVSDALQMVSQGLSEAREDSVLHDGISVK